MKKEQNAQPTSANGGSTKPLVSVSAALPTLSNILGLDNYSLTYSQSCDCITLYNHRGRDAALQQAIKFDAANRHLH